MTKSTTKTSNKKRKIALTKHQYQNLLNYQTEELTKREEKRFKKNQIISFVTILPLTIIGTFIKEIISPSPKNTSPKDQKKPSKEQEEALPKEVDYKIISNYEEKLKSQEKELISINQDEETISKKELENTLDKLATIIDKLDYLKKLLAISNLKDLDQEYLETLVDKYLQELKRDQNSNSLYTTLDTVIVKLDQKIDALKEETKEESISPSIEDDASLDQFNHELKKYEELQQNIEVSLASKIPLSSKISLTNQMSFFENKTKVLLVLITPRIFHHTSSSGIKMSLATLGLIRLIRKSLIPNTKTSSLVQDYSKEITSNINTLDNSLNILSKSKEELENLLIDLKSNYQTSFGKIKELDDLYHNLENLLILLDEKRKVLEEAKLEQEKALEENKEKVMTLDY